MLKIVEKLLTAENRGQIQRQTNSKRIIDVVDIGGLVQVKDHEAGETPIAATPKHKKPDRVILRADS